MRTFAISLVGSAVLVADPALTLARGSADSPIHGAEPAQFLCKALVSGDAVAFSDLLLVGRFTDIGQSSASLFAGGAWTDTLHRAGVAFDGYLCDSLSTAEASEMTRRYLAEGLRHVPTNEQIAAKWSEIRPLRTIDLAAQTDESSTRSRPDEALHEDAVRVSPINHEANSPPSRFKSAAGFWDCNATDWSRSSAGSVTQYLASYFSGLAPGLPPRDLNAVTKRYESAFLDYLRGAYSVSLPSAVCWFVATEAEATNAFNEANDPVAIDPDRKIRTVVVQFRPPPSL